MIIFSMLGKLNTRITITRNDRCIWMSIPFSLIYNQNNTYNNILYNNKNNNSNNVKKRSLRDCDFGGKCHRSFHSSLIGKSKNEESDVSKQTEREQEKGQEDVSRKKMLKRERKTIKIQHRIRFYDKYIGDHKAVIEKEHRSKNSTVLKPFAKFVRDYLEKNNQQLRERMKESKIVNDKKWKIGAFFIKCASDAWREMPHEVKQKYYEEFKATKEKERQIFSYTKRVGNPFMWFVKMNFQKIIGEECSGLNPREKIKIVSKAWRQLPDEEKEKYRVIFVREKAKKINDFIQATQSNTSISNAITMNINAEEEVDDDDDDEESIHEIDHGEDDVGYPLEGDDSRKI